jgi:hypothetical protein
MVLEEEAVYGRYIQLSFWDEKERRMKKLREDCTTSIYEAVFIHFEEPVSDFFFFFFGRSKINGMKNSERGHTLCSRMELDAYLRSTTEKKKRGRSALRLPLSFTFCASSQRPLPCKLIGSISASSCQSLPTLVSAQNGMEDAFNMVLKKTLTSLLGIIVNFTRGSAPLSF